MVRRGREDWERISLYKKDGDMRRRRNRRHKEREDYEERKR